MNKIKLLFGTVNSPKLGASDAEIEQLYQQRIRPMLKTLYAHQDLRVTFYFSGTMLEWLEAHHSEYLSALSEMVTQRRVELLGGGYYDPIFPIIPRQDRIAQVEYLTTTLRQTFGRRPRGVWLTNFFWEPDMPSFLNSAGIEYTFLDEAFFVRAGMESADLLHPAITEDQGKTLVVFPVSAQIRRLFWQDSPESVIERIVALGDESGERVIVILHDFASDQIDSASDAAAQFEWLERFIQGLEAAQAAGSIETALPSRLLKQAGAHRRAYFEAPTLEVVHGALVGESTAGQAEDLPVLLPGINRLGYFAQKSVRHSLARYPEANLLYAKMQYISSLIAQLRSDKVRKQAARQSLWKAQHHAAYWHGPDGGLYLNRYRKHAYTSLIESERQTRERGIFAPSFMVMDYDFDGVDEILFQGNDLNVYIHQRGGIVFELDYLQQPWNYADTCSRHPEMYHLAAHESDGFDSYDRRMFVDHILGPGVDAKAFSCGDYRELGPFTKGLFVPEDLRREDFCARLSCQGLVASDHDQFPVRLTKSYRFQKQTISLAYEVTNLSLEPRSFILAPEVNLSFPSEAISDLRLYAKEGKTRSIEIGPELQTLETISDVVFHDLSRRLAINLASSLVAQWWVFPLETNTKTASGFVKEYQATTVVPRWALTLEPGQTQTIHISLGFGRLTT